MTIVGKFIQSTFLRSWWRGLRNCSLMRKILRSHKGASLTLGSSVAGSQWGIWRHLLVPLKSRQLQPILVEKAKEPKENNIITLGFITNAHNDQRAHNWCRSNLQELRKETGKNSLLTSAQARVQQNLFARACLQQVVQQIWLPLVTWRAQILWVYYSFKPV